MAKGVCGFEDFPRGHPLRAGACAQGVQGALEERPWPGWRPIACPGAPGSVMRALRSREVPAHEKHSDRRGAGPR